MDIREIRRIVSQLALRFQSDADLTQLPALLMLEKGRRILREVQRQM